MTALLCRIGLHRWSFSSPLMTGTGAIEVCHRCGLSRTFHFAGAYEYRAATPIPPEAQEHFDRAFATMDQAFTEMNKGFSAVRHPRDKR